MAVIGTFEITEAELVEVLERRIARAQHNAYEAGKREAINVIGNTLSGGIAIDVCSFEKLRREIMSRKMYPG